MDLFIKPFTPQTAYCNSEDSNSLSSSNNKTSSWFGWWGKKELLNKKQEGFIGTMVTEAKTTNDGCDQTLKQALDNIDNTPLTPRRDKMRRQHAWEMHKTCKEKVRLIFDVLDKFGSAYTDEQPKQTTNVYSASYDFKKQKVEIKQESTK